MLYLGAIGDSVTEFKEICDQLNEYNTNIQATIDQDNESKSSLSNQIFIVFYSLDVDIPHYNQIS